MTTMIAVFTGDGCAGRCDAKCYLAWGPECHCVCQGANHGIGKQDAIDNTREMAESWLEQARAAGQDISRADLVIGARHQPLFSLDGAL